MNLLTTQQSGVGGEDTPISDSLSPLTRISVCGLRGLQTEQEVDFAVPNGRPGSGLTILVGSNNAGKSTFVEAIRILGPRRRLSLSEGRRNKMANDEVSIKLSDRHGMVRECRSARPGSSEMEVFDGATAQPEILVLPSRRSFSTFFQPSFDDLQRNVYASEYSVPPVKTSEINLFTIRLQTLNRDPIRRQRFDALMDRIVTSSPDWTIDENDEGKYYLKFRYETEGLLHTHTSDGLGEGLISLVFIVDALYDSVPGSMVVIDEPELSLHPKFQRRLYSVLSEMSADRQIVYATHSPYFLSWSDISNGARIARVHKSSEGTSVSQPSLETLSQIARLTRNENNPHILGIQASEVFFLEDDVILVEGQEDVVFLRKVLQQLGVELNADFFGWGVGGAANMGVFATLLTELGFGRVLGILDHDMVGARDILRSNFPEYRFECIATDDVRTKRARPATAAKVGLVDESGRLRPEHLESTKTIFESAMAYFVASPRVTL